jgi:hypothetical protein
MTNTALEEVAGVEDAEAIVVITVEAAEVSVAATTRATTSQEITPTKNMYSLRILRFFFFYC